MDTITTLQNNPPTLSFVCIQTPEKKKIEPGALISFRIGDGSKKITGMMVQRASDNVFVIALYLVPEKAARYIGRATYNNIRMAFPEIIVRYDQMSGVYKSEF